MQAQFSDVERDLPQPMVALDILIECLYDKAKELRHLRNDLRWNHVLDVTQTNWPDNIDMETLTSFRAVVLSDGELRIDFRARSIEANAIIYTVKGFHH